MTTGSEVWVLMDGDIAIRPRLVIPPASVVLVVQTLQRLRQPRFLADLAALLGGGVQLGGRDLLVLRDVQSLVQLALLAGRAGDPLLLFGHGGLLLRSQ